MTIYSQPQTKKLYEVEPGEVFEYDGSLGGRVECIRLQCSVISKMNAVNVASWIPANVDESLTVEVIGNLISQNKD